MKCCIIAAGKGSRMGSEYSLTHKTLLPLGNKAIISHIFELFDSSCEFVVIVGYKSNLIIDYISIAHPGLNVTYVEVDNFDGPGSGPGYSLYCAKELLNSPFFFTASDTIITGSLPEFNENWIGIQEVPSPENWCSITLNPDGDVKDIFYKKHSSAKHAFVGAGYIKDFELFWQGLGKQNLHDNELQVINGLESLLAVKLGTRTLNWIDTGSKEQYNIALKKFHKNFSFVGKSTDLTYKINNTVIKYFPDKTSAKLRYERALTHNNAFAPVQQLIGNYFSCDFIEGKLLSQARTYLNYKYFLAWAEKNLWRDLEIPQKIKHETLRLFYIEKTLGRLNDFCVKYLKGAEVPQMNINSMSCLPVSEILTQIADELCQVGQPSYFHGDLHEDNIFLLPNGSFKLIDWRESFGSTSDWGDRYYDLAKILHTLELSVDTMDKGGFVINQSENGIFINHNVEFSSLDATQAFWEFVKERKYDERRIRVINAIIFVNMSPLYNCELANYLYLLGRYQINKLFMDR